MFGEERRGIMAGIIVSATAMILIIKFIIIIIDDIVDFIRYKQKKRRR